MRGIGQETANKNLSQQRAESVRNYLIKKGITQNRIAALGNGSSNPVASNDTEDGRKKNRRTEVHVVKK